MDISQPLHTMVLINANHDACNIVLKYEYFTIVFTLVLVEF